MVHGRARIHAGNRREPVQHAISSVLVRHMPVGVQSLIATLNAYTTMDSHVQSYALPTNVRLAGREFWNTQIIQIVDPLLVPARMALAKVISVLQELKNAQ